MHTLDYHLILGLVGFFFDWYDFLGKDCLSDFLIHSFLGDVFFNGVERILIRNVDASMPFGLGSLNTNLDSRLLVITYGVISTSC